MFTCENCGSGLRFDPKTQKLVCGSCGASVSPEAYRDRAAMHARERELSEEERAFYQSPEADQPENRNTWQAVLMTCPQCGGQLLTAEDTAATFCSFCGASVLLESRVSHERKPDLIIPFQKTKEDCAEAYRKKLKRAVYVPKDMKSEEQIEHFRGIYMPYWVYSFSKEGDLAVPGKHTSRRGDYIITDHFSLHSRVRASYRGISYDASSSFSDNLSEAIAPFDYKQKKEFEAGYLSGFYADTADVGSYLYQSDAREAAEDHMAQTILQSPVYASYEVDKKTAMRSLRLEDAKPELAFYPVWFLASRNKAGDRVSYAVVNGQTGEIAADLPVDKKKLLIGTLILAVPIFLILNLFFTMTPTKVLAAVIVLGLIGLFLTNRQMNLIYCFENKLDDKGFQSKQNPWESRQPDKREINFDGSFSVSKSTVTVILIILIVLLSSTGLSSLCIVLLVINLIRPAKGSRKNKTGKKIKFAEKSAPVKDKMKVLWKPVVGLIAAAVILLVDPVSDVYYYAGCVIAMFFVAWSFWDTLSLHNRLSTRPLPQFQRRGGEEFENR